MAARVIVLAVAAWLAAPLVAAPLPDPTALPRALENPQAESAGAAPVLSWVRVNGAQSIAWYGGTAVKVGDAVEGGRVIAIREDHIVISGSSGRQAVYLLDEAIRTKPRAATRPPENHRK